MAGTLSAVSTVGSIAAEVSGAARVFEELGIDYCCAGRKPLAQACAARGLTVEEVLERLQREGGGDGQNWALASMTELADHIEGTHHAYLKAELPRLVGLIDKVVRAHGERHPEMVRVRATFGTLMDEMLGHMQKEERVLFPVLRAIDGGAVCGPLDGPVAKMMEEHDAAGALLAELRGLTDGFTPPKDACTTFRVLLRDMAALELDLHTHVHKENNILFPAALRAVARAG